MEENLLHNWVYKSYNENNIIEFWIWGSRKSHCLSDWKKEKMKKGKENTRGERSKERKDGRTKFSSMCFWFCPHPLPTKLCLLRLLPYSLTPSFTVAPSIALSTLTPQAIFFYFLLMPSSFPTSSTCCCPTWSSCIQTTVCIGPPSSWGISSNITASHRPCLLILKNP